MSSELQRLLPDWSVLERVFYCLQANRVEFRAFFHAKALSPLALLQASRVEFERTSQPMNSTRLASRQSSGSWQVFCSQPLKSHSNDLKTAEKEFRGFIIEYKNGCVIAGSSKTITSTSIQIVNL